jgi:hypothetical protein
MTLGRTIPQRIPVSPGRDSRHTIRHKDRRADGPWWVHYEPPGSDPLPADDPHEELVTLVNLLKEQMNCAPGGGFSINEHSQVIARMSAPPGDQKQAIHVIGVSQGSVETYDIPIRFMQGSLDPTSQPLEGDAWPGPLCGMSYTFAAPGNGQRYEEIWTEHNDQVCLLSKDVGISPYPPSTGALADFLTALRRRLPQGGRFRVNEHGRAFTSNGSVYVGRIPLQDWFRRLTATS